MSFDSRKLPRKSILATLVTSAIAFGAGAQDLNLSDIQLEVTKVQRSAPFDKQEYKKLLQKEYFVLELSDAPLATYKGEIAGYSATSPKISGTDKIDTQSSDAKSYAGYLKSKQETVVSELRNKVAGLKVRSQLDTVINAVIVEVPKQDNIKEVLASANGVKKVYENKTYYTNTDASLELINATEAWEALGGQSEAGKGINVAIIDTGINSRHPIFEPAGQERPESAPSDDYCAMIDPGFCNGKIAVARYYTPTSPVHPDEYISPEDFNGHGTHVAGTAAGGAVSATYQGVDVNLSGVAPGATLMVYKALFSTPEGTGSGSTVNLMQALEDAVDDGADVINNSWGGGAGGQPQNSAYTPIFDAAEEAGVLIATAAGNDGPGDRTIGCPGCIESGLTVANTQHGRTFAHLVDAAGVEDLISTVGAGDFEITEEISGPLMPVELIDDGDVEACDAFAEGSLEGHIAFVSRGGCLFTTKANNVQAAGAVAMIVYNNSFGRMVMSMPGATLPSVQVSQSDGKAILDAYDEGASATISGSASAVVDDTAVDMMSDSSSRGPNGDSSFLKPDIAAPGTSILSAYAASNDNVNAYGAISGTSMASPHVAGAAALMRQSYPELSAEQIKSMLMTSADTNVTDMEDGEVVPATPFDRGAGRLDVINAINTGLTLDTASFVDNGCVLGCEFTRVVTNLADADVEWQVSVEVDDANAMVSAPETLAIEANGTAELAMSVDTTYAERGWIFGTVTLTDPTGTFPDANIPVAIHAKASDSETNINTVVEGGEFTPGSTVDMLTVAKATGEQSPFSLITRVPEGTELVEGSAYSQELGETSRNGFSVSPTGSTISWAGQLNIPESSFEMVGSPTGGMSLADMGAQPVNCSLNGGCDENTLLYNFPLPYAGTVWPSFQVNTNGVVAFGNGPVTGTYLNQELPAPAAPSNIVAPFWSDWELLQENNADLYVAVFNNASGSPEWIAVEWNNATIYGDSSGDTYTFSVFININQELVVYNYTDIPSMPENVTIGLQDVTGVLGGSYYYNGSGSSVTSGDALQPMLNTNLGTAEVRYSVQLPEVATGDELALELGWDETTQVDIGSNFEATELRSKSHVSLINGDNKLDANRAFSVEAEGELSVEITAQPQHGTLEQVTEVVTDEDGNETEQPVPGVYVYTPEVEEVTEDSFSYVVSDEAGVTTSEKTVTVNVLEPNDPPEVTSPNGEANADGEIVVSAETNGTVTLSVAATDPDEDELTYNWMQVSGPEVEFEGQGTSEISFTAPAEAGDVVFEASVDDGRETVSQTFSVAVSEPAPAPAPEQDSGSSSSFGLLIGLLALPFAILRRRLAVARK
ncbi:S8 family serine peptidase [Idiomarina seosinensis]|nr:S8 family serine peptidase [Idiomarina seosinensis]